MEKEDSQNKIYEMQLVEQGMQNIILQKQAFQLELSETKLACKEIEKSEEVFKIIGQIMLKSDKEKIKEELTNKERILEIRLKSLENQENILSEKLKSFEKTDVKS